MRDDLKPFFLAPKTSKQRQYEALRAYVIDEIPAVQAARRFGFTEKSLYALAHNLRKGRLDIFPKYTTGPKDRRATPYIRQKVCALRKQGLSVDDIVEHLKNENIFLSSSTVERIAKDAGFGKLPRRRAAQRGLSKKNSTLSSPSRNIAFDELEPFHADCQVAGIFFFLPYIVESGIMDVLDELPLPQSGQIGKKQAFLSLLALKLIGGQRLCHVRQYDHDVGFGLFAGLNVLPKPTYAGTYSCLVSADLCKQLQSKIISCLRSWQPDFFSGSTINLDFHSIAHFGEESKMEKVWCGARNKAMKGANTFFAQDGQTNVLLYTNADVLRKDGASEILHFVDYLKDIKGVVDETLVFDSRLTTYKVLGELDRSGVKFVTLRNRCKSLKEQTDLLDETEWAKVKLPIPKRKHQKFLVHESDVMLKECEKPLRQIIMKDHGRAEPTYVITNNRGLPLETVLMIYARRWRIENKLAELINFFNLNALSSPIMVRIHFDILLSVVGSFLYHRLAQDLPRFEKSLAPDIFRRFVDMPGRVRFDGRDFELRIRKRAHTPILLGVRQLQEAMEIPWLDGRQIKIAFTS
ncbi:MAG: transposase [Deltaproteobacteria bacterium]|nr:transposase [Deltaproteobacteria bacterium]